MFAKSLAQYLEASDYGKIDTDILINRYSEREDMSYEICVSDAYSYSVRGRATNSVAFNAQIMILGEDGDKVTKNIYSIYRDLEEAGYIVDGDDKRFTIRPLNPPHFLQYDGAGRERWALDVSAYALNYEREE